MYRRLGKIQWDIVTWKIRFLHSLKYGRYTGADYKHAKSACKYFEIKNWGEYDLYVKSDTLLLGDVSGNFSNVCLEEY